MILPKIKKKKHAKENAVIKALGECADTYIVYVCKHIYIHMQQLQEQVKKVVFLKRSFCLS